jgi:hypothetical protein
MYYTASSVLEVLTDHPELHIDKDPVSFPVPSCPKRNDPSDGRCRKDFPECKGKTLECGQILLVKNDKGDPHFVNFWYYISNQTRDGRVSEENAGLKKIILKYRIDKDKMTVL